MTTIATDGHTVAGDGMVAVGDVIEHREFIKVFTDPGNKYIYGTAGSVSHVQMFKNWVLSRHKYQTRAKLIARLEDIEILRLDANGKVHWMDKELVPVEYNTQSAIGTGFCAAITALKLGESATRAVELWSWQQR